jgi:hypothetical protein
MLQAAKRSRRELGDAAELVLRYTREQLHPEGGFRDRTGASDLYYSVFGLQTLAALDVEPAVDRWLRYLRLFGAGEALDLVHLASLARAWAFMPEGALETTTAAAIADRVETHRSADGAYAPLQQAATGTVYASFLALGAYQDLQCAMPAPHDMLKALPTLRARDGGYANLAGAATGSTPATAAAAILMRQLDSPVAPGISEWLLSRAHLGGGFPCAL